MSYCTNDRGGWPAHFSVFLRLHGVSCLQGDCGGSGSGAG